MLTDTIITAITQFGAAGLMGLLWILERRHAVTRERQLDEAHRRLINRNHEFAVLLNVVRDNTRAISTLEKGQERLIVLLERMAVSTTARVA